MKELNMKNNQNNKNNQDKKINIKTRHSRLDSPTQTFVCAGPGA